MSFVEKPDMPLWARALVLMLVVGGALFSLGNLFVWIMGPCPAFSSNTVCEWSQAKTFWHFPVSQIATVIVIVLFERMLRKWTAA